MNRGQDAKEEEAARARAALVRQLRARGDVVDPAVLEAFAVVPRHRFLKDQPLSMAYADLALPLAYGQTISQPTMIGIMLDALACRAEDRSLEVGAGCGYAAALLAQLTDHVDAIEIRQELVEVARANLAETGVHNVTVHLGNGTQGLPARAPFDCILVSAGAESVPTMLVDQLAPGGRIALPVNDGLGQVLTIGVRDVGGRMTWRRSVRCLFVPLVTQTPPSS